MTVAQGEITLNGKRYATVQPVVRQPLDSFVTPINTSGMKQRGDRLLLDSTGFTDLLGGFGISRYRSPTDYNRFWDSTAETRFPGQITPSILEVDTTDDLPAVTDSYPIVTPHIPYGSSNITTWSGDVIFMGSREPDADLTTLEEYTFTGSTQRWAKRDAVDASVAANDAVILDVHGNGSGFWCAFISGDTGNIRVAYKTTAAGAFTNAACTGISASADDEARLWESGTTQLLAAYDATAGTIIVYKSTDSYANVTSVATISSTSYATGWATYYDRTGTERPLLATAEGVYAINLTDSTAELVLPMAAHDNNGRRMCVWEGRLYIPIGGTGGSKLHRVTWTGAEWRVETIGPGKDDGLPSDRQADIVSLWPVEGHALFAGTISTTAVKPSVFAIDTNGVYHHMWKGGTAALHVWGLCVSSEDDGTMRLHFTDGANLKLLKYPLDNPYTNSSITFTDGSYIDLPEDDGGIPEISKCVLEVVALASHSSSAEDIDITYGTDGAARTTTSLGSITSTDYDISFASGVGVSARSWAYRLTLDRGATTTNKVSLKTFTTNYLNSPSIRYEYYVVVDPDTTARMRGNSATPDSIRVELETVESSVTMVGFKYDRNASVNVKCLPAGTQWMKELERVGVSSQWGDLPTKGMIVLHLVELL